MLGRLLPVGWEQILNLQVEGDTPECLKGNIEGLATKTEVPSESTANGHGLAPAFIGSPVRGDDRGTGQILAIGKVVVEERLDSLCCAHLQGNVPGSSRAPQ